MSKNKNIIFEDRGLSGLANIANTCYMNTGIHLLSATLPLTYYFLSDMYKNDINNERDNLLLEEFISLFNSIWSKNNTINPAEFYKAMLHYLVKIDEGLSRFIPNTHQDLNEFIVFILDYFNTTLAKQVNINIHGTVYNKKDQIALDSVKSWKKNFENEYSIIVELFYGQFISLTSCPNCDYNSHNYEPFNNINLPIPELSSNINIYDCFDLLTNTEILDTNNTWKCENCKQFQNAEKKMIFWKLPNILIIFFNRFKNNRNLLVNIDFPLSDLDLTKYTFNYDNTQYNYNLYGIGNYIGNGNSGHYTATIKNKNNKWYHIDDNSISEVSIDIINNSKKFAYCLFYNKISK